MKAALSAFFLAPLLLVASIAVAAGSSVGSDAAAAAAAAVACTYGDPDPDRIAIAMEQLGDPVDEEHYDAHAESAGIDPATTPFSASTAEQRHTILLTAIRTIAATNTPRTVATPVLVWWTGDATTDDDAWQDIVVPGYGTLGDYITEYLDAYAVNDVVLASVTDASCAPSNGRCLAPDDLEPIRETIRTLESGGNYTAYNDGNRNPSDPRYNPATGAYQFINSTWNNYAGYSEARNAPPEIQDRRATQDILHILSEHGNDVAAVPVVWYIGELPPPGSPRWDVVPVPEAGNTITLRSYQTRWVNIFLEIAGPDGDTCPAPAAITNLAGPDCDGLRGTGATYNGKLNGTLNVSDLEASPWGPLQPAAAAAWAALIEAGIADGYPAAAFRAESGGPGARHGGYSNHTIGLALDVNALAWTPVRNVPGEPLPVAYVFDQPLYQWLRDNAWRYGWCNPRWTRPHYLNGSARGGKDAAGNGSHLEPWHWEFVGGSDHYNGGTSGDLNGPLGIPD